MPFWISSGAQRSPHTSNGQLWYYFGFNIVDQIHPNPFESIQIQPDPPRFGSAFSRLCEHMAQLSIRKSHPFGTAFPFERLSYGRNGLPFVNTFQSKWLSIRNGFGITPKGPMGPPPPPQCPQGAEGALGSPWPPPSLGPLDPPGSLGVRVGWGWGWGPWGAFGSKGSAPCRSEKRASRTLGGGADSAGENILGRRHARKRIWIGF